jgi:hypothetical protein
MADITIKVLVEATTIDLLTLAELKTMLGISTTDTSEDAQLAMWITQFSDMVATMCNRVFAKEKVEETWRGDLPPYDTQNGRVFLTHYPVADTDIESVSAPDGTPIDSSGYEIENRAGKLQFFNTSWSEPIRITYSGGYDLPAEAPPALKHAVVMLIREERIRTMQAQTAGIRQISHKEARVSFFDPNAVLLRSIGMKSPTLQAVESLLAHYMRFQV